MDRSYSAIIFDLGGVVLNLDYNLTINAFKELGKENFDKLYAQSQQDKIFDLFETGAIAADEFRKYMKSFFSHSVNDVEVDTAWNAMLLDLPKHRIDLLRKLKEYYRIYLFSNTNSIHLSCFKKIIKDQYGDPDLLETIFHQTYYSHLIGKRKPNADAFQTILSQHGLKAAETLFIDDSIQHIEGAKELGIQTIHLVGKDISDLNLLSV